MNAFRTRLRIFPRHKKTTVGLAILGVMLAIVCLARSIVICNPNEILLVGKPHDDTGRYISQPGFYLRWPWQSIRVFDGRPRISSVLANSVRTADAHDIPISCCIRWQLSPYRLDQFMSHEMDFQTLLFSACTDAIRDWAGTRNLTDILSANDTSIKNETSSTAFTLLTDQLRPLLGDSLGIELIELKAIAFATPSEHAIQSANELAEALDRWTQRQLEQARRDSQQLTEQVRDECRQMLARASRLARQVHGRAVAEADKQRTPSAEFFSQDSSVFQEIERYGQLFHDGQSVFIMSASPKLLDILRAQPARSPIDPTASTQPASAPASAPSANVPQLPFGPRTSN